jgi:hypothetical protein
MTSLPDFTPLMLALQAKNAELEHQVCMASLTFQLILERPDMAVKLSEQAMSRIQRSAA